MVESNNTVGRTNMREPGRARQSQGADMIFIIVMTDTAGLLFSVCCPAPLVPAQSARERESGYGGIISKW